MKSAVKDYTLTPAADKRTADKDDESGSKVLDEVKILLGEQRYNLWFSRDTVCRWQDDKVVFHVRNAFAAQTIRTHCQTEIAQAVINVFGTKLETLFCVEQRKKPLQNNAVQQTSLPLTIRHQAHPTAKTATPHFKSLDTFLQGTSNDVVRRAVDLALTHHCEINPLYIHGFSGTGKTHLLEGIWGKIKRGSSKEAGTLIPVSFAAHSTPLYMTSEQFISLFLESIRDNGKSGEKFRSRFNKISVLLLDDVQFLAGKEATQTEFLHILDLCMRHNIQIILTGDKPLQQLPLRGDVISRLEAGLSCGIDLPERDLALRICRQMVEQRKLPIGEDVCRMTAERYGSTVRHMQGALNRLHAALLTEEGKTLTLPAAEKVLLDFPSLTRVQMVTLKDVESAVCETFNIGRERLQSKSRTKAVTVPRMLAMYLARKYTQSALSEIGDFFGKMSHSSVISAQKKVDQWIVSGDKIIPALRRMERKLS